MKHLFILSFVLAFSACSAPKHLEMDPQTDLSTLPGRAQCWLVDFEQVCISLSENAELKDTDRLKSDIAKTVQLLEQIHIDEYDNWYEGLSSRESKQLHELMLAIVVYYGVKHFVDI